jgi:hypothetical protein
MAFEITREDFLDLKRLFIGGELREPSPFVLSLPRGPLVDCSGEGIVGHERGCTVDFGTLAAIGHHRRAIRVENLGTDAVTVTLKNSLSWLRARWTDSAEDAVRLGKLGEATGLELLFQGDLPQERTLTGTLGVTARAEEGEESRQEILVRLSTRMNVPFGRYDFHGAAFPSPHDFGLLDPAQSGPEKLGGYHGTVEPVGPAPLQVRLQDLPEWLAFEADGHTRPGPAPGCFYEREAPCHFSLRPMRSFKFLGLRQAKVVLHTNEARSSYQRMEIELAARFESERAYVYAAPPGSLELVPPGVRAFDIALSNWGSAPASLRLEDKSGGLEVGPLPVIPRAIGNSPGQEIVQVSVDPQGLRPGDQFLYLTLRVEDGSPEILSIPIRAHVIGLSVAPGRLEFGRLRPGERKAITLRFQASDGRILHLQASPRPAVANRLTVSVTAGQIHVLCQAPAESFTYEGPGLEVRDPASGFIQEIPVSIRVHAAFPTRRVAILFAIALLVVTALVVLVWFR